MIALSGLVGYALVDDKSLATLPFTTYVIGMATATVPASLLMKRVGRRAGFLCGAVFGLIAAALSSYAIYAANFWLFSLGTGITGIYSGFGQYYRFAAADTASESFKSRAISLVLAGGLVGGFLGPGSTTVTRDLFPAYTFMGSYMSTIGFVLAAMVLLAFVDIPRTAEEMRVGSGRALIRIVVQPTFLVAALAAMIGYGVVGLMMTATPLAMVAEGHSLDQAAFVAQWHVVAMFAPAFVTGSLIARFGVLKVMLGGAVVSLVGTISALSGGAFLNFLCALKGLNPQWSKPIPWLGPPWTARAMLCFSAAS